MYGQSATLFDRYFSPGHRNRLRALLEFADAAGKEPAICLETIMAACVLRFLIVFVGLIPSLSLAQEKMHVDPKAEEAARLSSFAMHRGDFAEARRLLEDAVRLDPNFAEAWIGRGLAASKLKDFPTAKASFEQGLRLHRARYEADPSNTNELCQQAFALIVLNRRKEAEVLLEEGLTRHPGDPFLVNMVRALPDIAKGFEKSPYLPSAP